MKYLAMMMICFLTSCSSIGGVKHALHNKNIGKEKVVERSGGKPDWVSRGSSFVKDGVLYSVGVLTDAPNLSIGMRIAQKRAQTTIVESLKEHLQTTYREAAEGLKIDHLDIQMVTFSSAEAIVSGFFPSEQYYEKKQISSLSGNVYKYDCYALVEITKDNYMKALDETLNGYKDKSALTEEFKEKVDAREEEFLINDHTINSKELS